MANLKKALESQLVRLMLHILKFMIQPVKRSASWIASINNSRKEIDGILHKQPSLRNKIAEIWDRVFNKAKREAKKETNQNCDIDELDWETVFNKKFGLDDDEK